MDIELQHVITNQRVREQKIRKEHEKSWKIFNIVVKIYVFSWKKYTVHNMFNHVNGRILHWTEKNFL